jgi:hypothetical protein
MAELHRCQLQRLPPAADPPVPSLSKDVPHVLPSPPYRERIRGYHIMKRNIGHAERQLFTLVQKYYF